GIGPKSANRIIHFRKKEKIRDLETLKGLGVVVKRAKDFVLLDGKRVRDKNIQLALFRDEIIKAV
ncbi:MAG TPA: biotin synthase, partial [bacterium]|nr:biotin synthase [bacterium]